MIIVMQIIILLHKEEYYQKYKIKNIIYIYDGHRISDMYKRETCVGRYIICMFILFFDTSYIIYIYIYIYICKVCMCVYSMVCFVKIPEKKYFNSFDTWRINSANEKK